CAPLTTCIAGERRFGGGIRIDVVQPHDRGSVLGQLGEATHIDAVDAIEAALDAHPEWSSRSFEERASVFLRAADLLAGPWRARVNAATMLGQSKTVYQAEI